jgi:hypothetical protein
MRKKYFLLLVSFCLAFNVFAQPGFGPEVGVGLSYMRFVPPLPYITSSSTAVASGRIGGMADLMLNKHVYFQPGLFLSRKGHSRTYSYAYNDSTNDAIEQKYVIDYVDLPVSVLYKTGIQGTGRFFFGLGATFSYIVGGSHSEYEHGKYNDTPLVLHTSGKIIAGKTLKPFDIGVSLTAGYEMATGLYFRAYYTFGANDIGLGGEIDKNRMAGIGAGYFFGKGRNIKKETDDLIAKPDGQ